jgi:hypothetical protein
MGSAIYALASSTRFIKDILHECNLKGVVKLIVRQLVQLQYLFDNSDLSSLLFLIPSSLYI